MPLFLCLFILKTPPWAAVVSVLAGLFFSIWGFVCNWSFEQNVFVIMSAGTLAFCATIPFYRYSPSDYIKRIEQFYVKMHTPVEPQKDKESVLVGTGQLIGVGVVVFLIGFFTMFLILMPSSTTDRLLTGMVAGIDVTTGGSMILYAKFKSRIRNKKNERIK